MHKEPNFELMVSVMGLTVKSCQGLLGIVNAILHPITGSSLLLQNTETTVFLVLRVSKCAYIQ